MSPEDDRNYLTEEWEFEPEGRGTGITAAVLMAIALIILVVSFVWFVIRLDPLTDDFIGVESATPTVTEPVGAP